MTLPNIITLARLFMVPVIVYFLVVGSYDWAFYLFVLAGISDAVDGYIAKTFDAASSLGEVLDPIADKVLLVSLFITLGIQEYLPAWIVILAASRDVMITGAVILSPLLGMEASFRPLFLSKINTTMQIVLTSVVLGTLAFDLTLDGMITFLTILVAATTILSGGQYLMRWLGLAADLEESP